MYAFAGVYLCICAYMQRLRVLRLQHSVAACCSVKCMCVYTNSPRTLQQSHIKEPCHATHIQTATHCNPRHHTTPHCTPLHLFNHISFDQTPASSEALDNPTLRGFLRVAATARAVACCQHPTHAPCRCYTSWDIASQGAVVAGAARWRAAGAGASSLRGRPPLRHGALVVR